MTSPWSSLRKKLHISSVGPHMHINANMIWEGGKRWHVLYRSDMFWNWMCKGDGGGVEKCRKDCSMWAYGSRRENVPAWKYVEHLFRFSLWNLRVSFDSSLGGPGLGSMSPPFRRRNLIFMWHGHNWWYGCVCCVHGGLFVFIGLELVLVVWYIKCVVCVACRIVLGDVLW